jgi:hypothetical protein
MTIQPDNTGEAHFDRAGKRITQGVALSRRRYCVELCLAGFMGFAAVLTVVWPAWIEGIFGWDPDGHSGAFEVLIVAGLAAAAACLVVAAWGERRARRRRTVLST